MLRDLDEARRLQRLIDRVEGRQSFAEFFRRAWGPGLQEPAELAWNWANDAVAEHLEAVTTGQIRRIIINIPPRHTKSLMASVAWPIWWWLKEPTVRFLCTSHGWELSQELSVKSLQLVQSPWFQDRYGDLVALKQSPQTQEDYQTVQGGRRIATYVGGGTGQGGDVLLVDDPHNMKKALHSDAERLAAIRWWAGTAGTRLNQPKTARKVLIMQRLHEEDLTGHILATEQGWDHLVLPARYERRHPYSIRSSIGFKDPRTVEGELLSPDRFPHDILRELEAQLDGERLNNSAGQLQQRPAHQEGAIIKRSWWREWTEAKTPEFDAVIYSIDTALSEKEAADYSAWTVWGIWRERLDDSDERIARIKELRSLGIPVRDHDDLTGGYRYMLIDAWRDRLVYPDLRSHARKVIGRDTCDGVLVENKAAGLALIADLRRAGVPAEVFDPRRYGDKVSRAQQAAPVLHGGLVYVWRSPSSAPAAVERNARIEAVINECASFPNGAHDDWVDTASQFLLSTKQRWWRSAIPGDPVDDEDDEPRKLWTGPVYA